MGKNVRDTKGEKYFRMRDFVLYVQIFFYYRKLRALVQELDEKVCDNFLIPHDFESRVGEFITWHLITWAYFFFVMYGLCACDLRNVCVYVSLASCPALVRMRAHSREQVAASQSSPVARCEQCEPNLPEQRRAIVHDRESSGSLASSERVSGESCNCEPRVSVKLSRHYRRRSTISFVSKFR